MPAYSRSPAHMNKTRNLNASCSQQYLCEANRNLAKSTTLLYGRLWQILPTLALGRNAHTRAGARTCTRSCMVWHVTHVRTSAQMVPAHVRVYARHACAHTHVHTGTHMLSSHPRSLRGISLPVSVGSACYFPSHTTPHHTRTRFSPIDFNRHQSARVCWFPICIYFIPSCLAQPTALVFDRLLYWGRRYEALTFAHKPTLMQTCMRTYIHSYISACVGTYIHIYIHTYLHSYMHAYIHA